MTRRQILTYSIAILIMLIGVQKVHAISIPSDTSVGTWNEDTRTYTLTSDVIDTYIYIDEDNLTFNGAGHLVFYTIIDITFRTGITVENVNGESGIRLIVSNNCTLINSMFIYCEVYDSDSFTMIGNTVSSIRAGVVIGESNNCTLIDNKICNCLMFGIIIAQVENFNVTGNTFSNNRIGIRIASSTGGQIYNNNFIDNGQHLNHDSSTFILNLPVPVGGNYWSNWTTPDDDGDGFVDIPYGLDILPWTVQDGWITPEVRIEQLITEVESLNLQQGISNSLDAKIDAVKKALDDVNENNDIAAVNALGAFINAVNAQRGGKISEEDADTLIGMAQQIIDLLTNG